MILILFVCFFAADSDTTDEVVFQDTDILNFSIDVAVIDQRDNEEKGIGDGVMRDVICTFVSNLAYSHEIGCEQKVPSVRHDNVCNNGSQ